MNPIREKLDRMDPAKIGRHKAELHAEAVATLAGWEAEFRAATEREDVPERERLWKLIRSVKADIKQLERK